MLHCRQVLKQYKEAFPDVLRAVERELCADRRTRYKFVLNSADLPHVLHFLEKHAVRERSCVPMATACDALMIPSICGCCWVPGSQKPLREKGMTVQRSMRVLPIAEIEAVETQAAAPMESSPIESSVNVTSLVYCIGRTVYRPASALAHRPVGPSEVG